MKRFLSLILAVTLVASLFTVNVMAASAQRTVTLTTDAAGDLKADDTVIVSIKIDTTELISTLQYKFTYDKDAFEIDTTEGQKIGKKNYPNFLEKEWLTDVLSEGNNWKDYFGTPVITTAVEGEVYCAWTDSEGEAYIEEEYAVDNDMIGNFILKVKKDAKAGEYTFGLKEAFSADNGEDTKTNFIVNTATVTVAGEAAGGTTPSISTAAPTATDAGIAANRDGEAFIYDNAYAVTVKMTNAKGATKAGMQFIPAKVLEANDDIWDDAAEVVFTTGLGEGEAEYTAALINIPRKFAGQTIKMFARGFMVVDGTPSYGKTVEKEIKYTITPEPGQN